MDIPHIKTIDQCNRLFAIPTQHPLVSVVHPSRTGRVPAALRFDFPTLWLSKEPPRETSAFGWKECDFADGTLVALKPGATAGPFVWKGKAFHTKGRLLCFHTTLLQQQEKDCGQYAFLHYRKDEALHLSLRERSVLEHEIDATESAQQTLLNPYVCRTSSQTGPCSSAPTPAWRL